MFDDDIKAGLDAIAERAPVAGDLEAIRSAGRRKTRLRSTALAVTTAVLLIGGGVVARSLVSDTPTQLSTDVADESLQVSLDDRIEGADEVETPPTPSTEVDRSPDDEPSPTTTPPTTVDDQATSTPKPEQTSTSISEPTTIGFVCQTNSLGTITWTDQNQDRYGIYRSVDDGSTYTWLARTLGQTVYSDPEFEVGHRYQIGHEGLDSRVPCTGSISFVCQVDDLGTLRWTTDGTGPYRIERSTDGGTIFAVWRQSVDGATTTDADYDDGHRYRIDHDGLIEPVTCTTSTEFVCQITSPGHLVWGDRNQPRYRIYRSINDGNDYTWLTSVDDGTSYVDPDHQDGYRYRIDYEGLSPRIDCS